MRLKLHAVLLLIPLLLAPCATPQAAPAVLDAKAAASLLSDRLWHLKPTGAASVYYWTWKSDKTVCVRFEEQSTKCDDTGRWKFDGDHVCYELTWWGESLGFRSDCFRIVDRGKGSYEAIEDNGLTIFEFSVSR